MQRLLSAPLRRRRLSTDATSDHSLASSAELAHRLLRRHSSDPQRLASALSASGLDATSPRLLDAVLRRCGAASSLALDYFHWCSPSLHSPPLPSSLALLAKYFSRSSAAPCPSLLAPLPSHLLSSSILSPVLRRLPPPRVLPFALSLLSSRPDHDHPPLFLSLLESLSKTGHVAAAERLVEELQPRLPLSLRHYTALLYGWCRLGKLDEAKHVLARMKTAEVAPDVVVFNTLLAGFVADGRFEDSFELTREMERRDCPPNAVSYTTLMQGLGSRGRVDEVMRVFVEMRRKGCTPDSVTYGTLVSAFCKAGRLSQGYEFLDAMSRDALRVDPAVYLGFFVAHEKKEQLEECLELMERMRECRCPPDLSIYNVVIRLSCKLGETKQAVTLWNEMENSRLSPGVDTFAIMVNGLVGQGSLVDACNYFKDMVGRGLFVAPQYGVLKDLLNALVRDEKLELAKDVWSCILSRGCELNVSAWTIWIHALYAKKHVKEACSYCLDMLEAGLMPQPDTFAKLMKGLKKLYNRQIAAEITEKVRLMAEERHVSFKMYKRRGVRDLEEKPKSKKKRGQKRSSGRQTVQDQSREHAGLSDSVDDEEFSS
jgi:pentatricopeptide repeat protein